METQQKEQQQVIDLGKVSNTLLTKKKLFLKVWAITFVLSCIWIFPQPRFYTAEVKLAPEMNGENLGGGLANIASSFGFDLGIGGGQDAIYPELYPDLFKSPEFLVGLFDIQIKTADGKIATDYLTYRRKHQKVNPLKLPLALAENAIKSLFSKPDNSVPQKASEINPFQMKKNDFDIMSAVAGDIKCAVDKKTSVISITVQDQDALVAACMADSIRQHLQEFITTYRTSKAREDVKHYTEMCDSCELEYNKAIAEYSDFCDKHKDVILQSFQSERDKLESEVSLRQNSLNVMRTQLQATKVKLQEKTPAFTTLQSATVPVKPAGPKRMFFVAGMLILSTLGTILVILRKAIANYI